MCDGGGVCARVCVCDGGAFGRDGCVFGCDGGAFGCDGEIKGGYHDQIEGGCDGGGCDGG